MERKERLVSRLALRRLPIALGVLLALAAIAGCGGSDGAKIALLLPENETQRYESTDRPDFEKKVEEVCGGCEVLYKNAAGLDSTQQSQAAAALNQGAEVLVVDPVNVTSASAIVHKAEARNVPVLSYDRLIEDSKPDAYVTFGEIEVGELQAATLAKKLKEDGNARGPIVMLNGEPGDRDGPEYEQGAHNGFHASGVKIAAEHTVPFWQASYARDIMGETIAEVGKNGFVAVYAASDDIAAGAISAMKAAGIDPVQRPTTGQNATVRGVQRILAGRQYMTVYKPIEREASAGAEIAVELAEDGEVPQDEITRKVNNRTNEIPSVLLEAVAVTKANVKQTVIADGFISASELCAGSHRADCEAAGIAG